MSKAKPQNRQENGKFAPGNCANPGGRPKLPPELKELAKAAAPEALKIAVDLMKSADNERVKLSAAEVVMDRAYGKATQHIEAEISRDKVKQLFEDYALAVSDVLNDRFGQDTTRELIAAIDTRFSERRSAVDAASNRA